MQGQAQRIQNIQTPLRAIIYCRVSTDKQEEDGQSLDYQEQQGLLYAERQGYQVIAVLKEVQSGYVHYSYRQKLTQARQMVRDRLADVIITWDLRRFSRNFVHSSLLFEEIEQAGGRIESISEKIDDSLTGKLIRSILSWSAESEREKIVEYANRHWQSRLAAGLPVGGGMPPYGWKWANDAHTAYEIDWEKAAVRISIFKMFVDEGLTLRAIKKKLEADNIPAPNGGSIWHAGTIRRLLSDGQNIGILTIAGFRRRIQPNGKSASSPSPERAKQIPGGIPRLVDDATFAHAQLKLKQNKIEKSRQIAKKEEATTDPPLLRAGYIFCQVCGKRMIANHWEKQKQYVCRFSQGERADAERTHRIAIQAPKTDEFVWNYCCMIFEYSGMLRDALEQAIDEELGKVKPGQLEKEIADLQEKMVAAYKERAALPASSYLHDLITQDLTQMDQQLQQLEKERQASAPIETRANFYKQRVLSFIRFLDSYKGRYEQASYQEKRDALELLGVKVTIAPPAGHWKQGASIEERITVEFAPRFMLAESTNSSEVYQPGSRLSHLAPLFTFRIDQAGALTITSSRLD